MVPAKILTVRGAFNGGRELFSHGRKVTLVVVDVAGACSFYFKSAQAEESSLVSESKILQRLPLTALRCLLIDNAIECA